MIFNTNAFKSIKIRQILWFYEILRFFAPFWCDNVASQRFVFKKNDILSFFLIIFCTFFQTNVKKGSKITIWGSKKRLYKKPMCPKSLFVDLWQYFWGYQSSKTTCVVRSQFVAQFCWVAVGLETIAYITDPQIGVLGT